MSYWYSGQVALWQGIQRSGLNAGDRVLVPAYSCGSELAVLLASGIRLIPYGLNGDLTPDLVQIERLYRETRPSACYVTHYFGFPQPMLELTAFAARTGLLLIEDCAHALFSQDAAGRWVGGSGDFSIFSLRKKLPIPCGGALVLSASLHNNGRQGRLPSRPAFGKAVVELAETCAKEFVMACPGAVYRVVMSMRKRNALSGHGEWEMQQEFDVRQSGWGLSMLAEAILGRIDTLRIVAARRQNYIELANALAESSMVRPLYPSLPVGCCPWYFPCMVPSADSFIDHMRRAGFWAGRFWRVTHPAMPVAGFRFERLLREHLVVLPIHQALPAGAAQAMAEHARKQDRRNGVPLRW